MDITSGRPDIARDADQWISQTRWFFLSFIVLYTQQVMNACVRRQVAASMVAGHPLDRQAWAAFVNQLLTPRAAGVASAPVGC